MRLRVGAVACLLVTFAAIGCRRGLDPNAISNQAPETWITAAPQETLTVKDGPTLVSPGQPGLIPVRFHLYWAGADRDGGVAGFWMADTGMAEPSAAPENVSRGLVWRFTTRTDSVFTFKASFLQPDRVHTIYICAMDDKGKIDPTPARLTFRAFDRYPPMGVIDTARAVGRYFVRGPGGFQAVVFDRLITDTLNVRRSTPFDTVASGTRLRFSWHGEPRALGRSVTGYLYSIGDIIQDSLTQVQELNVNNLGSGPHTFTLFTVGESDWRSKATRFFQMNFAPDTWFSGPDTTDAQWTTYPDGKGRLYRYRDVAWSLLPNSPGVPRTLLSADSVMILPVARPKNRTFLEIYGNRIWAHSEGDTVSLNSWVIVGSGGFDPDSPYAVRVGAGDATHPVGPVTTPGVANGSPVGFHYGYTVRKTNHTVLIPSESILYPVFNRLTVLHAPTVSAYLSMSTSGTVYLYTSAEDGDSTADLRIRRLGGPLVISDHVDDRDHYVPSQAEVEARDKLMVFYVNHSPYLKTSDGQFFPNVSTPSSPPASIQRGSQVTFNILAGDIDPLDYTRTVTPGGPQVGAGTILARTISIRGTRDSLDASGSPVAIPAWFNVATAIEFPNVSFTMPAFFNPGIAKVFVSVCDYRPSDDLAGNTGRCAADSIEINITGPQPSAPATGASQSLSRPGSTAIDGRRKQP